jgi:hypothetical protein
MAEVMGGVPPTKIFFSANMRGVSFDVTIAVVLTGVAEWT